MAEEMWKKSCNPLILKGEKNGREQHFTGVISPGIGPRTYLYVTQKLKLRGH